VIVAPRNLHPSPDGKSSLSEGHGIRWCGSRSTAQLLVDVSVRQAIAQIPAHKLAHSRHDHVRWNRKLAKPDRGGTTRPGLRRIHPPCPSPSSANATDQSRGPLVTRWRNRTVAQVDSMVRGTQVHPVRKDLAVFVHRKLVFRPPSRAGMPSSRLLMAKSAGDLNGRSCNHRSTRLIGPGEDQPRAVRDPTRTDQSGPPTLLTSAQKRSR
jgi:hypothetical protein